MGANSIFAERFDGGITIWRWFIHFCSTSNGVFVWNGLFFSLALLLPTTLHFLLVYIFLFGFSLCSTKVSNRAVFVFHSVCRLLLRYPTIWERALHFFFVYANNWSAIATPYQYPFEFLSLLSGPKQPFQLSLFNWSIEHQHGGLDFESNYDNENLKLFVHWIFHCDAWIETGSVMTSHGALVTLEPMHHLGHYWLSILQFLHLLAISNNVYMISYSWSSNLYWTIW